MDKKNLVKLIEFITELSHLKGNEWFKEELNSKLNEGELSLKVNPQIQEIYEFCIRKIIQEHAVNFYADFQLLDVKKELIDDFVRMEKFRREDNFEDFCLALFQQIEGIVNALVTIDIQSIIIDQQNTETHKVKNKNTGQYETQKLWQLIFYPTLSEQELERKILKPIFEWDFAERYKTILYIYYFNKKIYNYMDFQEVFFLGNELYQSRNLNHRGGRMTESQQRTIDKVNANSYKYYFKFLGYMEDFITTINKHI